MDQYRINNVRVRVTVGVRVRVLKNWLGLPGQLLTFTLTLTLTLCHLVTKSRQQALASLKITNKG